MTKPTPKQTGHTPLLFAMSRKENKAEPMTGFVCFEHLQGAFRCGIALSDGTTADGIGSTRDAATFLNRAAKGGITVIWNDELAPAKLEILTRKGMPWITVSYDIFRSWSGNRRINGKAYKGPIFWLGEERQYEKQGKIHNHRNAQGVSDPAHADTAKGIATDGEEISQQAP